jgi:cell division protease FtsH
MSRWPIEWGIGAVLGAAAFMLWRGVDPLPLLLVAGLALGILSTPRVREVLGRIGHPAKATVASDVTFDHIGGQDAAKRELREALDFLRAPEAALRLGVRPLRGVLLAGPPGTGKTMLAKAAARYTNSAFLAAAGSEFIEMYAGVGAQRVRDLFARARRSARDAGQTSAIVFVDEMDVLGAKRGSERSHLEYDQTLNQLLVEMDGMAPPASEDEDDAVTVLVIGATNRPDLLDDALTRPGRFDRIVQVDLPDRGARLEILRLKAAGRALADDVELERLAQETFGMSGAHLESLLNEAAILALRQGAQEIQQAHLAEAVEKVMMGERMDRVPEADELRRVAVHEGGHAMVAEILRPGSVASITVTSRGRALGYVRQSPSADTYLRTEGDLRDDIAVALAGAVAEECVLGSRSTGAQSDLGQAGAQARAIVLSGMSDLGTVSEDTLPQSDLHTAVTAVLASEEARARALVEAHRGALETLASRLLAEERLDGSAVRGLVERGDAAAAV